jgi:hypothetical protein
MREVNWMCDYCGQNIDILDEETIKKGWFSNKIVNGKGFIDVILHSDPLTDKNDPRKYKMKVSLLSSLTTKGDLIHRDICEDCLLQGKKHLDIGMPERSEVDET